MVHDKEGHFLQCSKTSTWVLRGSVFNVSFNLSMSCMRVSFNTENGKQHLDLWEHPHQRLLLRGELEVAISMDQNTTTIPVGEATDWLSLHMPQGSDAMRVHAITDTPTPVLSAALSTQLLRWCPRMASSTVVECTDICQVLCWEKWMGHGVGGGSAFTPMVDDGR